MRSLIRRRKPTRPMAEPPVIRPDGADSLAPGHLSAAFAQPAAAQRRDPAPSRAAYRMQRLWLTPAFRLLMRVGLPVAVLAGGIAFWFGQEANRAALAGQIAEIRRSIEERPEFMVRLMVIEGASDALTDTISAAVPVEFPLSSFDLDLAALRERIEAIDAVALAELRVRPGGILEISINERIPAVIWRSADGLVMLDDTGHRVDGLAARPDRPDLPLIAGAGAGNHVAEALRLLAASRPAQERIRGLVRVGERRWDVVLDRDQRILLPEANPVQALEQVMALDQAQELLARDVRVIDMRNIARPTLGLSPEAMAELRRIKEFETGVAYR